MVAFLILILSFLFCSYRRSLLMIALDCCSNLSGYPLALRFGEFFGIVTFRPLPVNLIHYAIFLFHYNHP